jgi:hypothetical protein
MAEITERISRAVTRADLVNRTRKILGTGSTGVFPLIFKEDPRNIQPTDVMNDIAGKVVPRQFLTVKTHCGDHDEIVELIADLINFARDGL